MSAIPRPLAAAGASLGAVALVTGAIFALRPVAPVLSLGVLYLLAVLPVAALWGLRLALPVSIVSMLAFNWLFLEPTHTFRLAHAENWVALAVYLATAVSVSGLAARARRRAAEAEQREREAALAAEVSALLLESREVQPQLREIASRVAALLDAPRASIELESLRSPDRGGSTLSAEPIPKLALASLRCWLRCSRRRWSGSGWRGTPARVRSAGAARRSRPKRCGEATPSRRPSSARSATIFARRSRRS